jgi:hypothetical protein
MSIFSRLNELTAVQNDFEDEITSGDHGRSHRGERREQLQRDLHQVTEARRDEIERLAASGTPLAEVAAQLDRTDRNRNR